MVSLFIRIILHFDSSKKLYVYNYGSFLIEKSSTFNFQAAVIVFNMNLINCNRKDGLEISQYAD